MPGLRTLSHNRLMQTCVMAVTCVMTVTCVMATVTCDGRRHVWWPPSRVRWPPSRVRWPPSHVSPSKEQKSSQHINMRVPVISGIIGCVQYLNSTSIRVNIKGITLKPFHSDTPHQGWNARRDPTGCYKPLWLTPRPMAWYGVAYKPLWLTPRPMAWYGVAYWYLYVNVAAAIRENVMSVCKLLSLLHLSCC